MDEVEGSTVQDRRTGPTDDRAKPASEPQKNQPRTSLEHPRQEESLPEMDFSTFVVSLASTIQMSLGAVPHPETNQTAVNLPAAKQMIDILALLQQKTKGNLSEQESALLEQVLSTLRIHYLRASEVQK